MGKKNRQDLQLHRCLVSSGWKETGTATLIIARRTSNGTITFGVFLVDVLGLGVKDAFGSTGQPPAQFQSFLKDCESRLQLTDIDIGLAKQIIWGGLEYGKRNGFRVPTEFHRWKGIIGPLEEGQEIDWNIFGKDGKPLIIGDEEDIMQRSGGRFDPGSLNGHYILGGGLGEEQPEVCDDKEDDARIPEGKERLILSVAVYEHNDFDGIVNVLEEVDGLDLVDNADEYAQFRWSRDYPENHCNPFSREPGARQILGNVSVSEGELKTETMTKGWCAVLHELLGKVLGDKISLVNIEYIDPTKPQGRIAVE